jgi:splicing factor 3A subunit 1
MDKIDITKVPDQQEFDIVFPQGVPDMDLDIIRVTAQYTAASGRSFLDQITRREEHNPQFAFLKVTHVLFKFFMTLVEHYTKVLKPPKHVMSRLKNDVELKRRAILERCVHRLEYEREVENKQKIKEAEKQADRVAFQSIDWHDFVVVETIEFKEGVVTTDMTSTAAAEQGDEEEEEEEDSDVDMDMDEDDDGDDEEMEIEETKTILDDDEEEIEIRPSYKPKIQGTSMEGPKYFVNEKTGQKIAVDQSAEIMRIQNLDPKWREQQLRAQAKTKKTALASSADLARNLARMARHREDIFGETSSKSNETASMDGTTVPPPPPRKDGGDDGTVPPPPPKRTRYE